MTLPPSSLDAIEQSLKTATGDMGLSLSDSEAARLVQYGRLLLRWNAVYNLTAIKDPGQLLTHHLLDCLAVVQPLQRHLPVEGRPRLLDAGSGAGLPGVVLSIMVPGLDVVCVDSVSKKTSFIRQAAAEIGIPNLRAEHQRLEEIKGHAYQVVTSRALSSLQEMVRITRDALAADGVWMAMKGKIPLGEIGAVSHRAEVFHVEPIHVPGLQAERCLVWMRPLLGSHP